MESYAKINSDGTLGTWTAGTAWGSTRYYAAGTIYNGYIYVFGGNDGSGTWFTTGQYAKLNSNGSIGAWTSTTSFGTARDIFTAIAYKGYMYVLGGRGSSFNYLNSVQYAAININGTLGSWAATSSFTTGRYWTSFAANNGYMYMSGGYNGSGLADVQYAAINSNGTLAAWKSLGTLPAPRYGQGMAAYDGNLYIVGGYNGGYLGDIQIAAINSNGTISTWQTNPTALSSATYLFGFAEYNGYFAVLGSSKLQYAPINSILRAGQFSKLIDLGSATSSMTSISFNGVLANGLNSISYKTAGSDGSFGSFQSAGSLSGGGGTCATGSTRYVWLTVSLDDSANAVFPDSGGTAANLTDMTLNYSAGAHPTPQTRLHGGKTLQTGVLSGLDTCGS